MSTSPSTTPSGFEPFGLEASIQRGIEAAGFVEPRPIQAATIAEAMKGRDVLGLAETGTGKTAAFALPILDSFVRNRARGPRALILAPTRELATQIEAETRTLARFARVSTVTIYGGVSQRTQVQALRKNPDIVVGCPGRVLDLIGQGELRMDKVEVLVLDEADHMFDMGFLPDVRRIMRALPDKRQNLLFSATMPKEIRSLADGLLRNPHVVELNSKGPARTIEHALVPIPEDSKRDLLLHILGGETCTSAIVFTRTKHRAKRLAQQLERSGHNAVALQGNMSQNARDRAMEGFRAGRFEVLVATDIVARGIDVQGVSHVINFDVPNTPEAYTHRIGRTGRAEREGQALTFATREDGEWLRATERKLGKPITRRAIDGFAGEDIPPGGRPPARSNQNRRGGNPPPRGNEPPRPRSRRRRSPGGGGGASARG